jgi:mRNA-degrading endonuclease toxin of MazEF toxin-antitoxin module
VCHQVTTLDRAKLIRKLGTLSTEFLQDVDAALMAAMDLD